MMFIMSVSQREEEALRGSPKMESIIQTRPPLTLYP